jgi:hypothetical protein
MILEWLNRASAGAEAGEIARAFGVRALDVWFACEAVLVADLAHSGEPAEVVQAAYWPKGE